MLGITVTPRWRLPGCLLLGLLISGCAARTEQSGNSGLPLPSVRMALLKIPLNRSDNDLLDDKAPIERFKPEPRAVANAPTW